MRNIKDKLKLKSLKKELKKTTANLDPFEKASNMCVAFLNGMKEKDGRKYPIRKLFYSEYKDQQEGCEPKIVAKIFEFAGISINKLNKDYKKAERIAFEFAEHPKNNITLMGANNVSAVFNFFRRLNTELPARPGGNPNENLFFQKLIHLKKFAEQGGKAYDKRKILRNIYEFAGLIPRAKHNGNPQYSLATSKI